MPKLHFCDLQVTRNRYAQTWLLGSLQDWVELHLIAHSNVKVNNTSVAVMVNILAKSFLIFEVVLLFLPCHHNNPPNFQVRNSAAFLLVSLVPSPHFRQTFRTPRNPPSQLRESIEALDGIDTVRRLLEFLLSLLRYIGIFLKKYRADCLFLPRNCKQYIDISCHGTTKLVSYFQVKLMITQIGVAHMHSHIFGVF